VGDLNPASSGGYFHRWGLPGDCSRTCFVLAWVEL